MCRELRANFVALHPQFASGHEDKTPGRSGLLPSVAVHKPFEHRDDECRRLSGTSDGISDNILAQECDGDGGGLNGCGCGEA